MGAVFSLDDEGGFCELCDWKRCISADRNEKGMTILIFETFWSKQLCSYNIRSMEQLGLVYPKI